MKNLLKISLISFIFAAPINNIIAQNKMSKITQPPVAKIVPKNLEKHGDVRVDNYYWLNQREDKDVIDYLTAENKYYEQMTAHTKDFRTSLFEEMKSRINKDDSSVPYLYNGYW